jgi:alanine-glyoxylate transaminase/serine-glyoxylate transaminase/serine-pyruvate transaminase
VLEALGRAPIGYLDPELFTLLDGLRADLRTVFGTANRFTLPLTGTGMAGMECCFANLLETGDQVVIGVNGFFGGRMVEICRRLGADVTVVEAVWGTPLQPEMMQAAIESTPRLKLVACVHAETSTGVMQPLEEIVAIAHRHGALFLADAVTSLGGIAVNIDSVGVDVCYSGSQKCLGAPPGISPITVSDRAMEAAAARRTPVSSWYYDWSLLGAYYDGGHAYHHTVPVNLLYAVRAALAEVVAEGLEPRFERHRVVSDQLLEGLAEQGIAPFAPATVRLPMLNAVHIPEQVADEAAVRRRLLTEYGIEIGGGLGALKGKIWRIGTMGSSATADNVTRLLSAMRVVLS